MSTLRLTTISNQGGTATVPSETVINGSAKAWVNFNGTGTVAIRASFNVSSITDNGTGDYTVNFTNAMTDANYSWSGFAQLDNATNYYRIITSRGMPASGSVRIHTGHATETTGAGVADCLAVGLAVFR